MATIFNQFDSNDQLVAALGLAIIEQLKDGIIEKGNATLAVSGGNSPRPLFDYLSQQDIHWPAVTVTLVDERWLSESHEDANSYLVNHVLRQNKATEAKFISLYNGMVSPYEAETDINNRLQQLSLPFDVVILGMGEDGHTASFFPQAANLPNALFTEHKCCAITPPSAPYQRMTLTLPTLLNTKRLFLHITGEKKRKVLNKAMSIDLDSNHLQKSFDVINEYPIRSVLYQNQPPLEIYYAD